MKAHAVHCRSDTVELNTKQVLRRWRLRRKKAAYTDTRQRRKGLGFFFFCVYIEVFCVCVQVCFISTISCRRGDSTHQCQLKVTASGTQSERRRRERMRKYGRKGNNETTRNTTHTRHRNSLGRTIFSGELICGRHFARLCSAGTWRFSRLGSGRKNKQYFWSSNPAPHLAGFGEVIQIFNTTTPCLAVD